MIPAGAATKCKTQEGERPGSDEEFEHCHAITVSAHWIFFMSKESLLKEE